MTADLAQLYTTFAEQHLQVANKGSTEWSVVCPLHGERNASMRLNIEKGVFYCHGCGVRGTVAQLAHKLGVPFTVDQRENAMSVLRTKLAALKGSATPEVEPVKFWPEAALDRYKVVPTGYWTDDLPFGRGFTEAIVDTFDLGYDPLVDHAIIPIRDIDGRILGVTRRDLTSAKRSYKDPKGFVKGDNLYASWLVRHVPEHYVVLMEGPLDAVKGWQAGHPSVAQYGSKLTVNQIRVLKELAVTTVIVCYDNDQAGEDAFRYACGVRTILVGGKQRELYVPENDLRRFFIVKRADYIGRGKDPGETTDADLSQMICTATYIR